MTLPVQLGHIEGTQLVTLLNTIILAHGKPCIQVEYKNHANVLATRRIMVDHVWYGSTEWHPQPGLLVNGFDLDKQEDRDYALMDFNLTTLRVLPGDEKKS